MKRLLLALGMVGLLAGCASDNNGMGGTSDEYNSSTQYNGYNSSDRYHSNATRGTGTTTATNMNSDGTFH